ncbi:MAG: hypothetical protein MJ218_03760 [Opitutales bacterium]|nr:hypothetical protein [Opitutales bacterium]
MVDPYHIFHETRWNKNLWFGSQTLINLGQIETYLKRSNDYDSILVGSSHTMNFKGTDLAKAVGAKGVLKLSSSDQGLPLGCEYARQCITTGKLRYVFFVIDACFYWSSVNDKTQLMRTIPIMKRPWLCVTSSECLRSIFPCYRVSRGFSLDNPIFHTWCTLDNIRNWYWRKENGFISWVSPQNLSKLRRSIPDFSQYTRIDVQCSIQRFNDLLKIFRYNPEVKFYLMMPPNSWISYKRAPRQNLITYTPYQMYHAFFFDWRHLVTACADLPNVKKSTVGMIVLLLVI